MLVHTRRIRFSIVRRNFISFNFLRGIWPSEEDLEVAPLQLISKKAPVISYWRAVSDQDYKGLSSCSVHVPGEEGTVQFTGAVIPPPESENITDIAKGFCAIKGLVTRPPLDLRDYQGIEVEMSSDVAIGVTLNMTCRSHFKDDLYQIDLQLQPTTTSFYIPFSAFLLTARGKPREHQRRNDDLQCEAIGLLVTEPDSKPLCATSLLS